MAAPSQNSAALIYIATFLLAGLHLAMGLSIDVSPNKYTEESTGAVQISCHPDVSDHCENKAVVILEIGRDVEKPLASVKLSGVSYGKDTPKSYNAQGNVDDKGENTFLNLTIPMPKNDHSGLYFCRMYFFDSVGMLASEIVSGNLFVEIFDLHSVVRRLLQKVADLEEQLTDQASRAETLEKTSNDLKNMTQELETEVKEQRTDLADVSDRAETMEKKSDDLEKKTQKLEAEAEMQRRDLADVGDRAGDNTAFSATMASHVDVSDGDIVVFGNVVLNEGGAYDRSTGTFTVPRTGIYSIQLTILTYCIDCVAEVFIMADDVVLATLYAYDKTLQDQSTVQVVRQLQKGAKVRPVSWDTSKIQGHDNKYTLFSGYLIRGN